MNDIYVGGCIVSLVFVALRLQLMNVEHLTTAQRNLTTGTLFLSIVLWPLVVAVYIIVAVLILCLATLQHSKRRA